MIKNLCLALVLSGLVLTASASQPLTEPGVLLTFDDTYVTEWVAAIPLLKKYNAHATFFVTRFDQLSDEQLDGLRKLKEAGHAIGCHGLRHLKAAEYTETHSIEDYLSIEITPALEHMEKAGFVPTSFAYPNSNNNVMTDDALLKTFRHLRTGATPKEGQRYAQMELLFTPPAEMATRGCLPGKGIDCIGEPGNEAVLEQLLEAMERAAKNREILTLYAHNIGSTGKNHLKPATLEKILAHGQHLGLRFLSFDERP